MELTYCIYCSTDFTSKDIDGGRCLTCGTMIVPIEMELDSKPVIIGPSWGMQRTVPQWMKEILEATGLIDALGQPVHIISEIDKGIELHEQHYHDNS